MVSIMQKKIIYVFIVFLIFSGFSGNSLLGQQDGAPITIGTYRTIHSMIMDEDRTLLIHLPRDYESSTVAYPVIYMLYGDHVTTYFAEAVSIIDRLGPSGRIPQMILVGIMNRDRYRDLLPESQGEPTGIGNFIRFLSEELFTYIEGTFRTKPYRVLIGPQAGANFSLYTMMKQPDMFNAFIINSPFRWTGGRDLMMNLAESFFQGQREFNCFMYITYNVNDELEKASLPYQEKFTDIVKGAGLKGFRLMFNYISEKDDFITPLGLKTGLKELYINYPFPEDLEVRSLDEILFYYKNLSKEYGYDVDAPDLVLTMQSDKLQEKGIQKEMLRILNYMLDRNPTSGNALWRLGNYFEDSGELEKAVDYYQRMIDFMGSDTGMIQDRLNHIRKMIQSSAAHQVWMAVKEADVNKGILRFKVLKSDSSTEYYFVEGEFNSLGYRLIKFNRIKDAIEIFKLNVEMNPASFNAYDSLAEAYLINGQKELAVINYQKSLELNPENNNARKMLEELRKK